METVIMPAAFDGVRVLELGQIYNGPYCGLLLAQLGADVIKIEPPGGEQLRFRSHQPVESHEFVMLNSNKRTTPDAQIRVRSRPPTPGLGRVIADRPLPRRRKSCMRTRYAFRVRRWICEHFTCDISHSSTARIIDPAG